MDAKKQPTTNLNKYISSSGMCSRREAEKFINEGRVTINGKPTQLGNRVAKNDVVKLDGRLVVPKNSTLYIALNKPIGIVSTTDEREPNNIVKHVNYPERLFPIGRLDKPSEGLIFLTTKASNLHEGNHSTFARHHVRLTILLIPHRRLASLVCLLIVRCSYLFI